AGPGASAAAEVSVIDIELGAMKFLPEHIMAPPGRVQLNVTNVDTQVHNLSILGMSTADLQPGQSEVLDLGVLDVGVFPFQCDLPGHASAGMVGELHILMNAVPGELSGTGVETRVDGATTDSVDHFHGFDDWETMEAAMTERA